MTRALAVRWGLKIVRAIWPSITAAYRTQEDESIPGSEKLRAAVYAALPTAAAELDALGLDVSEEQLNRIVTGGVEAYHLGRQLRAVLRAR